MKRCGGCGQYKTLDCFWRQRKGAMGCQSRCKDCLRAVRAQRSPEQVEEDRRKSAAIYERTRERRRELGRRAHLRRKFGLTPEQYKDLLEAQSGRCAICGSSAPGDRNLPIDHDHASGAVRGLLCDRCNRLIGLAADESAILVSAALYLDRFSVVSPPSPPGVVDSQGRGARAGGS